MSRATLLVTSAMFLAIPGSAQAAEGAGADIVGGSTTTIEEWPWQVAIADRPTAATAFSGSSVAAASYPRRRS